MTLPETKKGMMIVSAQEAAAYATPGGERPEQWIGTTDDNRERIFRLDTNHDRARAIIRDRHWRPFKSRLNPFTLDFEYSLPTEK